MAYQNRLFDPRRTKPAARAGVRVKMSLPFPPENVMVNHGCGPDALMIGKGPA